MPRRQPPVCDQFASMIAGLQTAGMRTGEIAEQAGLSRSTIWRAASGMIREPDWTTFDKLESLCQERGVIPVIRR